MRLPVLPLIFLFVLSFLIDLYISFDVKDIWKKKGNKVYWITSALCYAVLIVGVCLPRRDAGVGIATVMWLLFTFLSIYIGKLAYILLSLLGRFLSVVFKTKIYNNPFRWIGFGFGCVLISVMWIGAGYTRRHIEVIHENVYSEKLPESFNGFKIAQISDLHVGTWGNDISFIEKIIEKINSLNPDIIVFTGDIVNRESGELTPFVNVLSGLNAKNGVYSILGNHDYGDYVDWDSPEDRENNNRQLLEYEKKMGWHILNNEKLFITNGRDSIMLIGIENWGEPPFPQYGNLDIALSSDSIEQYHQNDGMFKLLLSHNPEHWNREVSRKTNIDLTLSGHTHAMQTMLSIGNWKWSPAKYRYNQWGGKYVRSNDKGEITQLYVNIGAGSVGMPARLMSAYPEITLIKLYNGNPQKTGGN